jgi:hypothetical protein
VTKRAWWGGSCQGTPRQPPDIVASIPDEEQVIYVGKHGDDADDGLNIESAKLTITNAIATAVAAGPTTNNRYAIVIHDGGTYTESFTVPSWVQLDAPAATIVGTVTLSDDANANVREYVQTDAIAVTKAAGAGAARLQAGRITVNGTGTAINVASGSVEAIVGEITATTAYAVAAGARLDLTVDRITGAEIETGTGVAYVAVAERIIGSRLLTPVSVGTGAAYTPVQTTAAMLAANNTSRLVSFALTHNEALANLEVGAGSVALMVARLNDGSQRIQSLASGLPADGAAPSLTGTLVTGVGWEATLNANGTVTIAVLEDATEDRSVNSRYFFTPLTLQVAP